MLKKILFITAVLMLSQGVVNAQKIKYPHNQFAQFHHPGGPVPQLKIMTPSHRIYTNKDFATDHHFFLIFFSPTCSHCINVTKKLCKHADLFKNTKVAFMARGDQLSNLKSFKRKTQIDKHPHFIVGVDRVHATAKLAVYASFPIIYIYNKNHELEKIFSGNISLSKLKQYLP